YQTLGKKLFSLLRALLSRLQLRVVMWNQSLYAGFILSGGAFEIGLGPGYLTGLAALIDVGPGAACSAYDRGNCADSDSKCLRHTLAQMFLHQIRELGERSGCTDRIANLLVVEGVL